MARRCFRAGDRARACTEEAGMTGTRFKTQHITFLGTLGALLVVANLGALLPAWRHPGALPGGDYHLVLAAISAGLTALLTVALFSLRRSLTGEHRQREAAHALLADRSRAQEEWQQTFNALTDLISVHDRDFKVVKVNSALCDFLGKRPEEIIGRPCYQVFHDRDRPVDGCPHGKARDVGHAVTLEIRDPHLGVPLLVTCSPFSDRKGGFAGAVHIARIQPNRTVTGDDPQRFIPICASCKDIRDEHGNWMRIENFVNRRFPGRLTHSICKECQKKIYPEFLREQPSSLPAQTEVGTGPLFARPTPLDNCPPER